MGQCHVVLCVFCVYDPLFLPFLSHPHPLNFEEMIVPLVTCSMVFVFGLPLFWHSTGYKTMAHNIKCRLLCVAMSVKSLIETRMVKT